MWTWPNTTRSTEPGIISRVKGKSFGTTSARAVVGEGRRSRRPPWLVVVPRQDPHLDPRGAERLDHVFADHFPEHGRHVRAVEQVAEDAEQGRAVLDGPRRRLGEVPVQVEGPLGDARLRIDPEIEAQAFVDIAHADDFVHPGRAKGAILLIMSTRRSAKVSNDRRPPM